MELLTIVELDLHLSDELIQEFFSNSKTNSNKLLDLWLSQDIKKIDVVVDQAHAKVSDW